jgi:tubulin polyglutamylase TTLL6/13
MASSGKSARSSRSKPARAPLGVRVNLIYCKYAVVAAAAEDLGWTVIRDEEADEWNLFWSDMSVLSDRVMRMKAWQRVNHFPEMTTILARKAGMARTFARVRAVMPEYFAISPRTWVLPEEFATFQAEFTDRPKSSLGRATSEDDALAKSKIDNGSRGGKRSAKTFIIKPTAGCQGRGIFLTRNLNDISHTDLVVAQDYIRRPFLIEGYKFDLRVYLLVASVSPLRVFLFDDGLVRMCSQPYQPPTRKNLSKVRMHLTNYAINKGATASVGTPDPSLGEAGGDSAESGAAKPEGVGPTDGTGFKRSILWFTKWLEEHGHDAASMWARVADLSNKALIAACPELSHVYRSAAGFGSASVPGSGSRRCFEILGLDILLDGDLRPWLLEVNHSPSFTCDAAIDWRIKYAVVSEAMDLLGLRAGDQRRAEKDDAEAARQRLYGDSPKLGDDETGSNQSSAEEARYRKLERTRCRMFRRIYPVPGAEESDELDSMTDALKRVANMARYSSKVRAKEGGGGDDDEEDDALATIASKSAAHAAAASATAAEADESSYPSALPWGEPLEATAERVTRWTVELQHLGEMYPELWDVATRVHASSSAADPGRAYGSRDRVASPRLAPPKKARPAPAMTGAEQLTAEQKKAHRARQAAAADRLSKGRSSRKLVPKPASQTIHNALPDPSPYASSLRPKRPHDSRTAVPMSIVTPDLIAPLPVRREASARSARQSEMPVGSAINVARLRHVDEATFGVAPPAWVSLQRTTHGDRAPVARRPPRVVLAGRLRAHIPLSPMLTDGTAML